MKSLIDNWVSIVVLVIIIFTITSFAAVETQLMTARHIHNSAINQIQESYYTVDIDEMNDKIKAKCPDWYIEVQELSSINTRKDMLVTLHYDVDIPIFNITKEGKIEGYAR